MKINCRYFCLSFGMALSLLFVVGDGVAGPGKEKQKFSAPERPNAMPEVVLLREQVHPHGESMQSKKIRGAKKHVGKKGFRTERGLRANSPQATRNRIVVVPGQATQFVEVRAVAPGKRKLEKGKPGKGKPVKGKPRRDDKSAKSAR